MLAVAVVIVVGVGAVTFAGLWLARTSSLEYAEVRERLHRPNAELLAYDVPNGEDPAEVLTALHRAGYSSVEELAGGTGRVLVECPGGSRSARPVVRAVIEAVGYPTPAGVRFADERPQDES